MNILVTGAYGQLGSEMKELTGNFPQHHFFFTDVDTLDITDKKEVSSFFETHSIDFVVNCAAYTKVDQAEEEKELAAKINADAPGIIAQACKNYNSKLMHISTDYVFDGKSHQPITEDAQLAPLGVYGLTKLEGEQNCLQSGADVVIIRTSWLYSAYGNNFVKTMIKLGKERDSLNVVFDQVGSPTYAADLAEAIMYIITLAGKSDGQFMPGIYHYSNEGVCSWYDFAKAIHELEGIKCQVAPVSSSQFVTKAKRPFYSVLDKTKIKTTYQLEIPYWRDSLKACLNKIKKQ